MANLSNSIRRAPHALPLATRTRRETTGAAREPYPSERRPSRGAVAGGARRAERPLSHYGSVTSGLLWALLASLLFNVGIVLQAIDARAAPRELGLRIALLARLFRRP